jgi:hypothetical protein
MSGAELAMERLMAANREAVVTRGEQFVVVEGRTVWFGTTTTAMNDCLPTEVTMKMREEYRLQQPNNLSTGESMCRSS